MAKKKSFARAFLDGGLPKIWQSNIGLSWHMRGIEDIDEVDVKQAVELGAMLLLDKPLILVSHRGAPLGIHLRRAADLVIEDIDPDDAADRRRMMETIKRFMEEYEGAESEHPGEPRV